MHDDEDGTQLPLDWSARAWARRTDPKTSKAAARRMDGGSLMMLIYKVVASYGSRGCIGDDIGAAMPHVSIASFSPRYKPMIERGMLRYTGETRTGKSGRQQMVRVALPPPFKPPAPKPAPRRNDVGTREINETLVGTVAFSAAEVLAAIDRTELIHAKLEVLAQTLLAKMNEHDTCPCLTEDTK